MYDTENGAWHAWTRFGPQVIAGAPKGIVVVSAHWENPAGTDDVLINVDQTNPVVYDFYNFPEKFYKEKFYSTGSDALIKDVKQALGDASIGVREAKRGVDHGVWVPFKIAFDGKLDIPLVQVSLPGDSSPISSVKLGKALSSLRDQGYTIIGTGQVVHNIRDYFSGAAKAYSKPFTDATTEALASSDPLAGTLSLFRHPLFQRAHPTPEHFLPFAVAVAATREDDKPEEIYLDSDSGLGWGMWRWASGGTAGVTA